MNAQISTLNYLLLVVTILLVVSCTTTKNIIIDKQNLRLVNRQIVNTDEQNVVRLNAQTGDGFALIEDVNFKTGTIEVELQGEDAPGRSFVGMAFNIQNDSTYEAIYFRPFNFLSEEKIRREHGVQYIYHPDYGWKRLRTENEGVYESEFINPPSPNDWFKIRISINQDDVVVIDPRSEKPILKVKRLTASKSQKIGFWTGFNSKGGYKNLKILK